MQRFIYDYTWNGKTFKGNTVLAPDLFKAMEKLARLLRKSYPYPTTANLISHVSLRPL